MANNEQLIADLGEAINLSNASQVRFGANNDSFNRTINAGLAQINATIRDIDGLLGQIMDRINELKARIAELQGNVGPSNANEIAILKQQLAAAQNGQVAATDVMNRALVTLRSNTEAMDGSIASQDEPAMTAQLKTVTDSLQAMQLRLRGILNDNLGPQPPARGPPKNQKPAKRAAKPLRGPLPGEEVPQGDQGAADNNNIENDQEFEDELARIDGGSRRRRRTNKKQCKTRRTNKKRKQKAGYGYKSKHRKSTYSSDTSSSSSTGIGRGRGMYKKSKKLRSTRS